MADFVKVFFRLEQDEGGYPPVNVESVWAHPAARDGEYVLDNVPFFARVATFGDTVKARLEGGCLWYEETIETAGGSLVRLTFFDSTQEDAVVSQLSQLGCEVEHLKSHHLWAIHIPRAVHLSAVQQVLERGVEAGILDHEEAILRQ